jgi:hypothetical protein
MEVHNPTVNLAVRFSSLHYAVSLFHGSSRSAQLVSVFGRKIILAADMQRFLEGVLLMCGFAAHTKRDPHSDSRLGLYSVIFKRNIKNTKLDSLLNLPDNNLAVKFGRIKP